MNKPPYKDQRPITIGKCGYFGEDAEIIRLLRYHKNKETDGVVNEKLRNLLTSKTILD